MMGTVGGTVQMFVAVSTVARAQILSGTVRGLAVTTAQRSTLLADLPTMVESGYPNFVMPGWGGFLAPANTPKEIVQKLNGEMRRAVLKADVQQRLLTVGMETCARASGRVHRQRCGALDAIGGGGRTR